MYFVGYSPESKGYHVYDPSASAPHFIVTSQNVVFLEGHYVEPDSLINLSNPPSSKGLKLLPFDIFTDDVAPIPTVQQEQSSSQTVNSSSAHNSSNIARTSGRERHPVDRYGDWEYSFNAESYMIELDDRYSDPATFHQAMASDRKDAWVKAMQDEIQSNLDKHVWDLTVLPPGKRALTSKWVYRTKELPDGSRIEKARIVARGFEQVQGVDFHEIFAPTIRSKSLRTLLAIGAAEDMEIHQLDVKTAFLNGKLQEEVYMHQPQGFVNPDFPDLVCKLNRTLYGLRQAPREWFLELTSTFAELGLHPNPYDSAVYMGTVDGDHVIIGVYVDDMPLLASSITAIVKVKHFLANKYDIKDLGEIKFILGIRVSRNRAARTITLSQRDYIDKVVSSFGLQDARSLSIPMKSHWNLWPRSTDLSASALKVLDDLPYRQIIGSMMYAMTATHPDIAYAIGKLSRYLCTYTEHHFSAAKDVLHYLKGTRDVCLVFNGALGTQLTGLVDSAYIDKDEEGKSTTGYLLTIAGGAVEWRSVLQKVTAHSSAEAEYMAAGDAASAAIGLRLFLESLGFSQPGPTPLEEDNQPCIAISLNDTQHIKTRHIKKEYHFIRDYIRSGDIQLVYTPTAEQAADALTKPATKCSLAVLFQKSGLHLINDEQEC